MSIPEWHVTCFLQRTLRKNMYISSAMPLDIVKRRNWLTYSYGHSRSLFFATSVHMMTSSNGNIFHITGSLCGEFIPDCLLNRLFRHRTKKTPNLRVTVLCKGNPSVTGEFPSQRANNAENVSIWWRHHESLTLTKYAVSSHCQLCIQYHYDNVVLQVMGNVHLIIKHDNSLFVSELQRIRSISPATGMSNFTLRNGATKIRKHTNG